MVEWVCMIYYHMVFMNERHFCDKNIMATGFEAEIRAIVLKNT
jgi:hypothetical protein